MSFKQILDLNYMTLELLQRQEYTGAVRISSKALRLLKSAQDEISQLPQSEDQQAHNSLDQCILLSAANESVSSHAKKYIYNQGIVLPPTMTNFNSISAILIFNSALAQHLSAETSSPSDASIRLLLKAKRMYELASRLHEINQNVLFQFVLVNNSAVISEKVGDMETSKTYFEFLMSTFMLFVDQQCTEEARQVRGFLRNLPMQHGAAAAAA